MNSRVSPVQQLRLMVVADLPSPRPPYAPWRTAVEWHRPDVICILGELLGGCAGNQAVIEAAHELASLPVARLFLTHACGASPGWEEFVSAWPHAAPPFVVLNDRPRHFGFLAFETPLATERTLWITLPSGISSPGYVPHARLSERQNPPLVIVDASGHRSPPAVSSDGDHTACCLRFESHPARFRFLVVDFIFNTHRLLGMRVHAPPQR